MKITKIVFIGAGSVFFGLSTFKNIFSCGELEGSTLSLVDINRESLDIMYEVALKMNDVSKSGLTIQKTMDRRIALDGASFVINSIAIERCNLWEFDFKIPRKYGIRQTLGENGGPGCIFFTMRTIPVIMDIIRDMEDICPNAYFLNFSNPESRIILALGKYSKIKSIGICHGIYIGLEDAARIMGIHPGRLEVFGAGLNHFQWLLQIRDRDVNEDLYPLLREKDRTYDKSFMPLSRKLLRIFGFYPTCGDAHMGEYLPYGWEGGEKGYDFEWDENNRKRLRKEIDERLSGEKTFEEWLSPTREREVDIITSILHNKRELLDAGIVHNKGIIANIPYDSAVEVPVMLDAGGLHPISIGKLPLGIACLLSNQANVQQISVEAAVHGSKELALQAMLIDPLVNDTVAAEKITEELWEINRSYIRKCI